MFLLDDPLAGGGSAADGWPAAFESLAGLPNGDGIPFLIKVARTHTDIKVRRQAIEALGESEDARARKALLDLAGR